MSATASTFMNRSTPGVYATEIPAFGTSIIGVPTAVPVFIGYTQCAGDPVTGASLYNTPVPIGSMTDFQNYFGTEAPARYVVTEAPNSAAPSGTTSSSGGVAVAPTPSFYASYTDNGSVSTQGFLLTPDALAGEPNQFNMYWSVQSFFANGGGDCIIISVGSYWANEFPTPTSLPNPIPDEWMLGQIEVGDVASAQPGLAVGLDAAANTIGPTMIVVPEACQLSQADYATVTGAMLDQASSLKDRVAIFDLPGCLNATTFAQLEAGQDALSEALAPYIAGASYGTSYAPALNTTVISANNLLYTNLQAPSSGSNAVVNNILSTQAKQLYANNKKALANIEAAIAQAFPLSDASGDGAPVVAPTDSAKQLQLNNLLLTVLPVYKQMEQLIANSMNTLPASGMMAGVWAKSDYQSGVWNAPANIALASVSSPLYVMSNAQQGGFNMPTNGEAINIIRVQPNRGNVVWGARTLDGNSQDFRYIQVRRTLIYLESSIKLALQRYVFDANDATTWSTVTASVSSFLTGLWQQGGLMGSKPAEAYTVKCGLGSTMTAQDVLNGYMVVAVTLQMVHPAEFIELTFTQTMGS